MKRGRKAKPTSIKKLEGNPGKRALPKGEPEPQAITGVAPPPHLPKIAREEWRRLSPELIKLGLLTVADLGALSAYCAAWSDFVLATRALQRGGIVTKGKEKQPVRSPWFIVKYKAMESMVKFGDRFGFSPASRVSLAGLTGEQTPAPPPAAPGANDGRKTLDGYLADNPDAVH